jgi:hypothetical protein
MRFLVVGWFSATAEFGFYLTFILLQARIYGFFIAVVPTLITNHAKNLV